MSRLVTSANLVTAIAFSGVDGKAPAEFLYLPEGSHKITPLSQQDGITVHVPAEKGEAIAAALNADLQKRMGDQVKPWTDFEHTRKFPASGYPKSFRYGEIETPEGVKRGVIAATNWSGSGRRALEDKDVLYFSPEFYVDENGVPSGLPSKGPIGGLVTEPAFREMGAVAASDSHQPTNTMSKLIFAALSISAAAENAETEAVSLIEKMKQENQTLKASAADKDKEISDLKSKITASEAAESAARKERADTLVKAAVADGRILPKDEDKQNKFREKISAGDSFAEEILAQLPKINGDLGKQVVTAASGKPVTASGFEAKAQQLVTAGSAPDIDTALGIVASEDPEAYNEYLKSLG